VFVYRILQRCRRPFTSKKKSREYKDGEIQKSEGKKNELLPTHNLIIRRPSVVNVTPFSPPMTLVLCRMYIHMCLMYHDQFLSLFISMCKTTISVKSFFYISTLVSVVFMVKDTSVTDF
jgi:hypothetical protein